MDGPVPDALGGSPNPVGDGEPWPENPMKPLFEEHNQLFRGLLRVLGSILVLIGAIFALVGLVDFFGAFSGHGFPTKF